MHCPWHMNPDKQLQAGLKSISLMPLELWRAHKKYSLCHAVSVGITFSITSHSSPEISYQKILTQEVLLKFPGKTCGAKGAVMVMDKRRWCMEEIRYSLVCEDSGRGCNYIVNRALISGHPLWFDLISCIEMMQHTWQEGNRLFVATFF